MCRGPAAVVEDAPSEQFVIAKEEKKGELPLSLQVN